MMKTIMKKKSQITLCKLYTFKIYKLVNTVKLKFCKQIKCRFKKFKNENKILTFYDVNTTHRNIL